MPAPFFLYPIEPNQTAIVPYRSVHELRESFLSIIALLAQAVQGPGSPAEIWHHIVADFSNITEPAALAAFGSVLMIDLVLAGDNAIVVGALAAGLPADQRKKVILIGIGAALVLRILFALIVTWLMGIVGLIFAGGLLLLWVSWKFWREIRHAGESAGSDEIAGDEHSGIRSAKSFAGAAWAVAVADVSMSLDNVLAVAGAAREHPGILVVGLLLSVALMGLAANLIARIIDRYRWIAYLGLAVILIVAGKMIYEGWVGTGQTPGIITLFS
jgi:YjbE family integral membrane protein